MRILMTHLCPLTLIAGTVPTQNLPELLMFHLTRQQQGVGSHTRMCKVGSQSLPKQFSQESLFQDYGIIRAQFVTAVASDAFLLINGVPIGMDYSVDRA
jgi:hypothetical protein